MQKWLYIDQGPKKLMGTTTFLAHCGHLSETIPARNRNFWRKIERIRALLPDPQDGCPTIVNQELHPQRGILQHGVLHFNNLPELNKLSTPMLMRYLAEAIHDMLEIGGCAMHFGHYHGIQPTTPYSAESMLLRDGPVSIWCFRNNRNFEPSSSNVE